MKRKGTFARVGENLYRYSSSKTYFAVFRRGGKLHWVSLKTHDRELANRRLKEELAKIGQTDLRQEGFTLAQLVEMYEQQLGRFDAGTQQNRRSILKALKNRWEQDLEVPVADVTPAQVEVWLAQQQARMSRTSLNAYIIVLRQLFGLAVAHRVVAESPARNLKMLKPENPIRESPSWEQFQQIVENVRAQRLNADARDSADLVEFMGLAGVGTAECANLLGEHVSLEKNKITLYRSKTDTGYVIPIFPQVLPLLRALEAKGRIKSGQPVFRVRDPKKALDNACKRLGFPHFSPRSLRRCFITRAVEKGIDFKTIAAWQGHRDGGVLIAKTYSHLRSEHSDAMARKLM